VQFAVGLGFAVSLQLEIQVTVCRELEFAVCLALAFCRVHFLCRVPDIPGWQQISSYESTGCRRVACLPCASTRQRIYGFIAVC
jgi:hypothetical protein